MQPETGKGEEHPLSAVEVRVLSRLLDQAQSLAPAEREAWMLTLPAAQQSLTPRLRQRLSQIEGPVGGAPSTGTPVLPPPSSGRLQPLARRHTRHGERVGPFRLLAELGAPGPALFWQAEWAADDAGGPGAVRPDASRQPVALMLLDAGSAADATPPAALPPHPHLVGFAASGVDMLGRPWRTMDWVDGVTLVEHARRRRLTEPQRLALLLPVCAALATAHAAQRAHGAIRPARIRVDDEGRVLLLDWGQGRPLDAARRDADLRGLGDVIDALFGGRPPVDDIAPIVRRARHPEPSMRYASVEDFAADLERVLEDRPVQAGRVSLLHRSRLLLRRRRTALGIGSAIAALLGGVVATGWQQHGAQQRHADRTERMRAFVAEQLHDAEPPMGGPPDPARLGPRLQRAVAQARTGFDGDPVLRGQVLTALAARYNVLGQPDEALLLLQEAHALLLGTARADDPALHGARAFLAQQLLHNPGSDATEQATLLARQVLSACPGTRCELARLQAGEVLKRLGTPSP